MLSRIPINSRLKFMSYQFYRCHFKTTITILFIVLVLVGAYLAFLPGIFESRSQFTYFTVVLDCGSTGTRINVYEWLMNSQTSKALPKLIRSFPDHSKKSPGQNNSCVYHCMQTEPGLDSFVHNSSGVREALEPLLLWAERHIPYQRHRDTSIFLLGTAGLRKLPREDANWILRNAEAVVKTHRFIYQESWIRVISGEEEAQYGWVALNYRMGRLGNSFKVPTLGVLDLGGSSLQLVKETSTSREDKHTVRLKIGLFDYQILAWSLPTLGLNKAFDKTIIMLAEAQARTGSTSNNGFKLKHPCLSTGLSMNYTCHDCFLSNSTVWGGLNVELRTNHSTSFYLVGDLDWEQCKQLVSTAVIHSSISELVMDTSCRARINSSDGTKLLNLTSATWPVARFHALSGFFVVYSVTNLNPRAHLKEMLETGQQLCSKSWFELKKLHGNRKYAERLCFQVTYITSLINDALCMGDIEIIFGPGDVFWTLGAALIKGKYIWLMNSKAQAGSVNFKNIKVFLSSLALLFTLILWFFVIVYWARVRQNVASVDCMPGKKEVASGALMPSYTHSKRKSNNLVFAAEEKK